MTSTVRVRDLFDGDRFIGPAEVTYGNGKIVAICGYEGDEFDADIMAPGLIDVQVNGGGGSLFNTDLSVEGLAVMAKAHAQFGTTAMLPTLITDSLETIQRAADAMAKAIAEGVAGVVGIHFEGPHLAAAKKGTHAEQFIRPISDAEMAVYTRQDLGKVMVTLAGETVPPEQIAQLKEAGVIVVLGHTNCTYAQAKGAIEAGVSGFTHLFNAMSNWTGRELGAVGAALMHQETYAGIIADGFHLAPETIQLVDQLRNPDYNVLVTDSMSLVGTDLTEIAFFDRVITNDNGKLTSTTGELAGSNLDMIEAVRYCIQDLGIDPVRTLRMATVNPARWISDEQRGVIAVGKEADFILASNDWKLIKTVIAGTAVTD